MMTTFEYALLPRPAPKCKQTIINNLNLNLYKPIDYLLPSLYCILQYLVKLHKASRYIPKDPTTMSNSRSHPLRRISTGSLSNLARSQEGHPSSTTSPSNLDFLTGPLLDLSDEAAALATHVHAMNRLHDSLGTFNEAFAGYLYALRMNAFCVEWTEVSRCRLVRIMVKSVLIIHGVR